MLPNIISAKKLVTNRQVHVNHVLALKLTDPECVPQHLLIGHFSTVHGTQEHVQSVV